MTQALPAERPERRNRLRDIAVMRVTERGIEAVSLLWIILIVVLVLALLGFFSRSVW